MLKKTLTLPLLALTMGLTLSSFSELFAPPTLTETLVDHFSERLCLATQLGAGSLHPSEKEIGHVWRMLPKDQPKPGTFDRIQASPHKQLGIMAKSAQIFQDRGDLPGILEQFYLWNSEYFGQRKELSEQIDEARRTELEHFSAAESHLPEDEQVFTQGHNIMETEAVLTTFDEVLSIAGHLERLASRAQAAHDEGQEFVVDVDDPDGAVAQTGLNHLLTQIDDVLYGKGGTSGKPTPDSGLHSVLVMPASDSDNWTVHPDFEKEEAEKHFFNEHMLRLGFRNFSNYLLDLAKVLRREGETAESGKLTVTQDFLWNVEQNLSGLEKVTNDFISWFFTNGYGQQIAQLLDRQHNLWKSWQIVLGLLADNKMYEVKGGDDGVFYVEGDDRNASYMGFVLGSPQLGKGAGEFSLNPDYEVFLNKRAEHLSEKLAVHTQRLLGKKTDSTVLMQELDMPAEVVELSAGAGPAASASFSVAGGQSAASSLWDDGPEKIAVQPLCCGHTNCQLAVRTKFEKDHKLYRMLFEHPDTFEKLQGVGAALGFGVQMGDGKTLNHFYDPSVFRCLWCSTLRAIWKSQGGFWNGSVWGSEGLTGLFDKIVDGNREEFIDAGYKKPYGDEWVEKWDEFVVPAFRLNLGNIVKVEFAPGALRWTGNPQHPLEVGFDDPAVYQAGSTKVPGLDLLAQAVRGMEVLVNGMELDDFLRASPDVGGAGMTDAQEILAQTNALKLLIARAFQDLFSKYLIDQRDEKLSRSAAERRLGWVKEPNPLDPPRSPSRPPSRSRSRSPDRTPTPPPSVPGSSRTAESPGSRSRFRSRSPQRTPTPPPAPLFKPTNPLDALGRKSPTPSSAATSPRSKSRSRSRSRFRSQSSSTSTPSTSQELPAALSASGSSRVETPAETPSRSRSRSRSRSPDRTPTLPLLPPSQPPIDLNTKVDLLKREAAATKIQALQRGRFGRARASAAKVEQQQREEARLLEELEKKQREAQLQALQNVEAEEVAARSGVEGDENVSRQGLGFLAEHELRLQALLAAHEMAQKALRGAEQFRAYEASLPVGKKGSKKVCQDTAQALEKIYDDLSKIDENQSAAEIFSAAQAAGAEIDRIIREGRTALKRVGQASLEAHEEKQRAITVGAEERERKSIYTLANLAANANRRVTGFVTRAKQLLAERQRLLEEQKLAEEAAEAERVAALQAQVYTRSQAARQLAEQVLQERDHKKEQQRLQEDQRRREDEAQQLRAEQKRREAAEAAERQRLEQERAAEAEQRRLQEQRLELQLQERARQDAQDLNAQKIQRAYRSSLARRETGRRREQRAATKIQALARGRRTRRELAEAQRLLEDQRREAEEQQRRFQQQLQEQARQEKEDLNAQKIQRVGRGWLARREAGRRRAQRLERRALEHVEGLERLTEEHGEEAARLNFMREEADARNALVEQHAQGLREAEEVAERQRLEQERQRQEAERQQRREAATKMVQQFGRGALSRGEAGRRREEQQRLEQERREALAGVVTDEADARNTLVGQWEAEAQRLEQQRAAEAEQKRREAEQRLRDALAGVVSDEVGARGILAGQELTEFEGIGRQRVGLDEDAGRAEFTRQWTEAARQQRLQEEQRLEQERLERERAAEAARQQRLLDDLVAEEAEEAARLQRFIEQQQELARQDEEDLNAQKIQRVGRGWLARREAGRRRAQRLERRALEHVEGLERLTEEHGEEAARLNFMREEADARNALVEQHAQGLREAEEVAERQRLEQERQRREAEEQQRRFQQQLQEQARQEKEDRLAQTAQKLGRGWLARREVGKRRENKKQREAAATKIQALQRGRRDRARVAEMRQKRLEQQLREALVSGEADARRTFVEDEASGWSALTAGHSQGLGVAQQAAAQRLEQERREALAGVVSDEVGARGILAGQELTEFEGIGRQRVGLDEDAGRAEFTRQWTEAARQQRLQEEEARRREAEQQRWNAAQARGTEKLNQAQPRREAAEQRREAERLQKKLAGFIGKLPGEEDVGRARIANEEAAAWTELSNAELAGRKTSQSVLDGMSALQARVTGSGGQSSRSSITRMSDRPRGGPPPPTSPSPSVPSRAESEDPFAALDAITRRVGAGSAWGALDAGPTWPEDDPVDTWPSRPRARRSASPRRVEVAPKEQKRQMVVAELRDVDFRHLPSLRELAGIMEQPKGSGRYIELTPGSGVLRRNEHVKDKESFGDAVRTLDKIQNAVPGLEEKLSNPNTTEEELEKIRASVKEMKESAAKANNVYLSYAGRVKKQFPPTSLPSGVSRPSRERAWDVTQVRSGGQAATQSPSPGFSSGSDVSSSPTPFKAHQPSASRSPSPTRPGLVPFNFGSIPQRRGPGTPAWGQESPTSRPPSVPPSPAPTSARGGRPSGDLLEPEADRSGSGRFWHLRQAAPGKQMAVFSGPTAGSPADSTSFAHLKDVAPRLVGVQAGISGPDAGVAAAGHVPPEERGVETPPHGPPSATLSPTHAAVVPAFRPGPLAEVPVQGPGAARGAFRGEFSRSPSPTLSGDDVEAFNLAASGSSTSSGVSALPERPGVGGPTPGMARDLGLGDLSSKRSPAGAGGAAPWLTE